MHARVDGDRVGARRHNESAATASEAPTTRRASCATRAACPMLAALLLMKAIPSRGPRRGTARDGVGQRGLRGHDLVPTPGPALAQQRQGHVRQHAQVAGAERAELAGERHEAGVQRVHQRVQQLGRYSRTAHAELVGAHDHRRPNQLGRRAAGPRRRSGCATGAAAGRIARRAGSRASRSPPTPVVTP